MEPIEFKLEKWTLNSNFYRIKNSRVVSPPYEKAWNYSNKFFLDKRLWLEEYFELEWMRFTDEVVINGKSYYYYQDLENNKSYIWTYEWWVFTNITPTWFTINNDSPLKIVKWKWLIWPKDSSARTVLVPEEWEADGTENWDLIPNYAWWYYKFKYSGVNNLAVWDYILFHDNTVKTTLKGWVNRIEYISGDYVYIIGTNNRWTIPWAWVYFDVYKQEDNVIEWSTILVWATDGVHLVVTNGSSVANVYHVLKDWPIKDIVEFDGNIFALTSTKVYFSRTTYEDNTQFYPLDRFGVIGWFRLFPIGKVMLLFWDTNYLFVPINVWTDSFWYAWYPVNYQWELYSKYSQIFADQTIYIVQKDKQLKQVNIVQNNNTAYDLIVSDVLTETIWLFNWLEEWWEMFIDSSQRFLNFLYMKDNKTTNYQFDKMYKHFIENDYSKNIYKISNHILSDEKVFNENGFTDDTEEYQQEINFMMDTRFSIYKPYILRTIFWLVDNPFNVKLKVEFELWAKLNIIEKELSNFNFDVRLSDELTWDELLEDSEPQEQSEYNGNIASIQSNILLCWRFIRYKYYSYERFMMWNSYIISDMTKPFINEPLLTN